MNWKITSLLLFLLTSLTGCFEIIEEIEFQSQTSGIFRYTINMSKSKENIKSAMLLDSFKGVRIPDRQLLSSRISAVRYAVKASKGISEVKLTEDFNDFIFRFECKFSSINDLNEAISKAVMTAAGLKKLPYIEFFTQNAGVFSRQSADPEKMQVAKRGKVSLPFKLPGATYTAIYRFTKEVSVSENSRYKLSKDKKAVMFRCNVEDLLSAPSLIENNIKTQ